MSRGAKSSDVAEFAPIRFSTQSLPEHASLSKWQEEFGRGVVRVDIEPLSDSPFRAEATIRALPGLRTVTCSGSSARFRRTPAMVADGDDSVGLVVNLRWKGSASQCGREVVLGTGDAVPIFCHEPAVLTGCSHLGMHIPRTALASRVHNLDEATMRPIPRASEPLRLLMSYMSLLPDKLALVSPKLRRVAVGHVHDLVALVLSPHRTVGESGLSAVAAARLDLALDQIAKSFQQPELTVAAVSHGQGVSPRYLQRLIETTGTSFTLRVNELRLLRAFALLVDARYAKVKISDIALQAGFSDISHFNRLFRSRFGDTPSGVRVTGLH